MTLADSKYIYPLLDDDRRGIANIAVEEDDEDEEEEEGHLT